MTYPEQRQQQLKMQCTKFGGRAISPKPTAKNTNITFKKQKNKNKKNHQNTNFVETHFRKKENSKCKITKFLSQ